MLYTIIHKVINVSLLLLKVFAGTIFCSYTVYLYRYLGIVNFAQLSAVIVIFACRFFVSDSLRQRQVGVLLFKASILYLSKVHQNWSLYFFTREFPLKCKMFYFLFFKSRQFRRHVCGSKTLICSHSSTCPNKIFSRSNPSAFVRTVGVSFYFYIKKC
jgi:hypothetical protein